MIKIRAFSAILVLCGCALPSLAQQTQPGTQPENKPGQPVSYNYLLPWAGKAPHVARTAEAEAKAPFQIFDNVYYVGPLSASTYIIKTDQGLILIDPTLDYVTDSVLEHIRTVGLNPKDIKYILISHGHWDHTAGVAGMQKATGAKVAMAAGDWDVYEAPDPNNTFERIPRDMIMKEGDVIELGNTTIQLYVTPGHTTGCLTMVYTVYDHGKPYKAMTLGGTGYNAPPGYTKKFIESMQRMRAIPDVTVLLPDHPEINDIFALEQKLQMRQPGEPNPFVIGREAVLSWFDTVIKGAQEVDRLKTLAKQE
jgi:metallo-beta-lactamase class B